MKSPDKKSTTQIGMPVYPWRSFHFAYTAQQLGTLSLRLPGRYLQQRRVESQEPTPEQPVRVVYQHDNHQRLSRHSSGPTSGSSCTANSSDRSGSPSCSRSLRDLVLSSCYPERVHEPSVRPLLVSRKRLLPRHIQQWHLSHRVWTSTQS